MKKSGTELNLVTLIEEGKTTLSFYMKIIKETQGSGFYIFESRATGNSNYIESIIESKRLLTYFNYYLKDYLTIHDYILSRHGFQIAVKLKPSKHIIKTFTSKSKNMSKLNEGDIWRIISEKMRLAISCYVRFANRNRKRKGTLVEEKYSRYFFEKKDEAIIFLNRMRQQKIKSYQRKKYRGIKSHYKISNNIGKGSIFLCSLELIKLRKNLVEEMKTTILKGISDLVVLKFMDHTLKLHKSSKPPKFNHPHPQ